MSFFDEDDEPTRRSTRRPSRTRSGGARRPPTARRCSSARRSWSAASCCVVLHPVLPGPRLPSDARKARRCATTTATSGRSSRSPTSQVAKPFFDLLNDAKGQSPADLQSTISGYRTKAEQQFSARRSSRCPTHMVGAQRSLLERARVPPRRARRDRARITAALSDDAEASDPAVAEIAGQMQAFLASDVVYSQRVVPLHQARPRGRRRRRPAHRRRASSCPASSGSAPPTSPTSSAPRHPRAAARQQAASRAGPARHRPAARRAPATSTLQPGQPEPHRRATTRAFAVRFTNQGENDETDVKVTLTIEGGSQADHRPAHGRPRPARARRRRPTSRSARRRRSATPVTITVEVKPVPGEKKTDNNRRVPGAFSSAAAQLPRAAAPGRLPILPPWTTSRPSGIVALAAAGVALVALLLALRPRGQAAPAARATSAPCSGDRARGPRRPRRRAPAGVRRAARLGRRGRRQRSTSAWATPRSRLDGAIAYRALVRYDAYGELSGHQSTSIALLDARRTASCCPRSCTATRRACTPSRSSRARGELELSPEEAEAVRLALAGERPLGHARLTDARRLPRPAGTFTHEALLASPGAADWEPVPLADGLRHGDGRARRRVDRALVPIENSLEGSRQRDARRARVRDRGRRDRRRGRPPGPPLPDRARARCALGGDRDRRLAPAGQRAVRALHPHAPAARRGRARRARPPTRCAWWPRATAGGHARAPRSATGWRRELYGCEVLRDGVEDAADNETRFVWLAPTRRPSAAAARPRALEDVARVLGRRLGGAGLARALPVGVRLPRREPDEDRVAAAQAGARQLHVLRRPRGRASDGAGGRRDRGPARARPRSCACSAPTPRPERLEPRQRAGSRQTAGSLGYTARSAHGHRRTTSPSAIRVARHAPAARTCD